MTSGYWQDAAADEAMQHEHGFLWKAMVDTVDVDLTGMRVLDAGCNRGGFLRMLVDAVGIGSGAGYDPAAAAIDDARALAGPRPLVFEVADTVPGEWGDFDVAFSHEVIYLIDDLAAHAADVHRALSPGASYYATLGVHADSALTAAWHASAVDELAMPPIRHVDEVAQTFAGAGFDVAVARLKLDFVPVDAHRDDPGRHDLAAWLAYYHEDKYLIRFTRSG